MGYSNRLKSFSVAIITIFAIITLCSHYAHILITSATEILKNSDYVRFLRSSQGR